jgi:hypothetical protein
MAKQLKQYTRVSDIKVGDAGVASGDSGTPTMPMLTYAAEELPVRVTSDTCDMRTLVFIAASTGIRQSELFALKWGETKGSVGNPPIGPWPRQPTDPFLKWAFLWLSPQSTFGHSSLTPSVCPENSRLVRRREALRTTSTPRFAVSEAIRKSSGYVSLQQARGSYRKSRFRGGSVLASWVRPNLPLKTLLISTEGATLYQRTEPQAGPTAWVGKQALS